MDRVKEIKDVIIGSGDVLLELIERGRKSGIVLPESSMSDSQTSDFGIVVAVGSDIKDIEVGDIVLRTRTDSASSYQYKGREFIMLSRYNISIAVKPANFDDNEELSA